MTRRGSEAREQERVIDWARFNEYRAPELAMLYHVPNGGSRDKREAANLKRQGVKRGVPDLCLPVPGYKRHGLYIEMKYGKNKPTEEQQQWIDRLRTYGYEVRVCYSAEEAIAAIASHIGIVVDESPIDAAARIAEESQDYFSTWL